MVHQVDELSPEGTHLLPIVTEELDEIQARAEKIFLTGKDSGAFIGLVLYLFKSHG